jgi:hypothetical protein
VRKLSIHLQKPAYKLWSYEESLREKEIEKITSFRNSLSKLNTNVEICSSKISQLQRLAF